MSLPANDSNNTTSSKRRCLYDILNVSRNASNDQLKSAYKQQAKKWHPDRNINNTLEATQRFKEINEAYEILSDKHERAWYDAHRDAILRGIDKTEITNTTNNNNNYDPDIDLMPYFSPFIFQSFDDNDINSYYNIYNNLFIRIIELEKLSKKKTPLFGNSKLSYEKLNNFYSFWEIFESRRSFQFLIKYNLNDASNRKMRKAMHKENRNLINSSRKKWEESIMRLVSFIKKRDPRWRNYKLYLEKEKAKEEEKIREYENEIEEIMREQQKLEMKEELIKIEKEIENEPIEIEQLFECIVCNKVFKSQNAFNTHENSKKHKKELHELKMQLNIENEILFKENNNNENNNEKVKATDYEIALEMERNYIEQIEREDIINYHLIEGISDNINENIKDENINMEGNIKIISDEEIIALLQEPDIDIETLIETYNHLDKEYILALISSLNENNKGKKRKRKNKKKKKKRENIILNEKNENNNSEEFMKQFKGSNNNKQKDEITEKNEEIKLKKKKKRRRRNKTNNEKQNQMNLSSQINNGPIKSKCKACNEMFPSKSKLYNHLKVYPKHALKSQH